MNFKKIFYTIILLLMVLSVSACFGTDEVKESFSVAFVTNCDLEVPSQNVKKGEYATAPIINRDGYTLEGWYTDQAFTNYFVFNEVPITKSITLYANWVINVVTTYTVSFVSNGGSEVASVVVYANTKVSKPADPVYQNHDFTGWYTDSGLKNLYNFDNTIGADLILYAGWTSSAVNQFTVTFNVGEAPSLSAVKVNASEKLNEPTEPVYQNHHFLGWYTDSSFTNLFDFNTPITSNITLYAKWELVAENDCVVTFNSNGGSTVVSQVIKVNSTVSKPINPSYEGYEFIGWFTDINLTNAFDFNTPITTDTILYASWKKDTTVGNTFKVTFSTDGGNAIAPQDIKEGQKATKPIDPKKDGFIFEGWYTTSALTVKFDFQTIINANITLYAKYIPLQDVNPAITSYGTFNEALYAQWNETNASTATAYYKAADATDWIKVDDELVRKVDNTTARVDVVGIKEGFYSLRIVDSKGTTLEIDYLSVTPHDRSGYAHFNYDEGVGAYNNDGTLKDGAIVIYVTEDNKNTLTIPGYPNAGVGIGWILNNNQYGSDTEDKDNNPNTNWYTNGISVVTKDHPVVIRIIGKVTNPDGTTAYNSTDRGGSKGDNGHMVRMKNAKHLTIEGIGEDAMIYDWGIHFMSDTSSRIDGGYSFEVRNITFDDYPEDALGMEGVQSGSTLTSPVERCWIHNNTFLSGYAENPAESDKKAGDGSCDFKRGQYYTLSYNLFDTCMKTNLVGASDSNLQFHITMHHNTWKNCQSRIPLARQANIHMYNNLFLVTDTSQQEISYAQNTRANSYIFSEANYFQAYKNPSDVRSGAIKSYGDIKYSTFGSDGSTIVTNRTALVNSSNKFSNFDTNPEVFYYDTVTKSSDVYHITSAEVAKAECLAFSGVNNSSANYTLESAKIYNTTPTLLTEDVSVDTKTKVNKGVPVLIFTIQTPATFKMSSDNAVLVDIYGRLMLAKNGTVEIEAGTYVIESAQARGASKGTSNAKETNINSYSITLDNNAGPQARIDAANAAISALPSTITYNAETLALIEEARVAYNALKEDEKPQVNVTPLTNAEASYVNAGVTYVQGLINAIGTVTETSYNKINEARNAYNNATLTIKNNINNYQVLLDAEVAFEGFATTNVINLITALPAVTTATDRNTTFALLDNYLNVLAAYENLNDEGQKTDVTNASKLLEGITVLEALALPYELSDLIAEIDLDNITLSDSSNITQLHNTFNSLSEAQKASIPTDLVTKLNEAWDIYTALASQAISHNFTTSGFSSEFFTISGSLQTNSSRTLVVHGELLTQYLKIESKTTITFTTTTKMTFNLYFLPGSVIKYGGSDLTADSNGLISITLEAGNHTFGGVNRKSEVYLFYMELLPAN